MFDFLRNTDFNKVFGVKSGGDKIAHAIIGFLLGLGIAFMVEPLYGVIVGVLVGFGKEVIDKYVWKSRFDFFDMFATIVGTWVGIFTYGFIQIFI